MGVALDAQSEPVDPIELDRVLESNCTDWRVRGDEIDERPEWYRDSLRQLGDEIMYGINRAGSPGF